MLISTVDLQQSTQFSVALVLNEDHQMSRKEICWFPF